MSIYQLWYAIAEHVFTGVTEVAVLELFSVIATFWTVIMVALSPYFVIRKWTR